MPTMTVDLSNVSGFIGDFPNGIYEARVLDAELTISQSSGEPMINLEWELHDDDLGHATLRDNLPYKFPAKVKAFYMAANNLTHADMQDPAHQKVELDPDDLQGLQMLIQLGEREGMNKQGETQNYKTVAGAWYFPADRIDLLRKEDTPF